MANYVSEFDSEQIDQAHKARAALLQRIEKSAANASSSMLKDLAEAYAFLVNPESGHGIDVKVKS